VTDPSNINVPNHKPVVSAIPNKTITVGDTFDYQVKANDSDLGDILTYSIDDGPAGMSISPTGEITWIPTAGQAGKHTISVNVSDGTDNTIAHFTINVKKKPTILGFTNLDSFLLIFIAIIIVAILIIIIIFNWWRMKEKSLLKK
jgi:hypothetical protein